METGSREDSSLRNLLVRTAAEPQPALDIYETALARAEQRLKVREAIYRRERSEAVSLVPELLGHPPERQQLILRNNPRYCTWGVLEQLLERSWAQSFESPVEAERLARLALLLADRLDASFYGAGSIEAFRPRAWGYIGNARRLRADLTEATRAFAVAVRHPRRGTREPGGTGLAVRPPPPPRPRRRAPVTDAPRPSRVPPRPPAEAPGGRVGKAFRPAFQAPPGARNAAS